MSWVTVTIRVEHVLSSEIQTHFFATRESNQGCTSYVLTVTGCTTREVVTMGNGRRVVAGTVGALLLGLSGPAWAADEPTQGDDNILGTPDRDVVDSLGGDDTVYGYRGNDELRGGAGDDQLLGGRGSDLVVGGTGRDSISGGPRLDSLYGHAGGDLLRAGAEDDIVVPGNGVDEVHAGPGDDEIFVFNDGKRDRIFCDGGVDWVEISLRRHQRRDHLDTYVDCENVYVDREGVPS